MDTNTVDLIIYYSTINVEFKKITKLLKLHYYYTLNQQIILDNYNII